MTNKLSNNSSFYVPVNIMSQLHYRQYFWMWNAVPPATHNYIALAAENKQKWAGL